MAFITSDFQPRFSRFLSRKLRIWICPSWCSNGKKWKFCLWSFGSVRLWCLCSKLENVGRNFPRSSCDFFRFATSVLRYVATTEVVGFSINQFALSWRNREDMVNQTWWWTYTHLSDILLAETFCFESILGNWLWWWPSFRLHPTELWYFWMRGSTSRWNLANDQWCLLQNDDKWRVPLWSCFSWWLTYWRTSLAWCREYFRTFESRWFHCDAWLQSKLLLPSTKTAQWSLPLDWWRLPRRRGPATARRSWRCCGWLWLWGGCGDATTTPCTTFSTFTKPWGVEHELCRFCFATWRIVELNDLGRYGTMDSWMKNVQSFYMELLFRFC